VTLDLVERPAAATTERVLVLLPGFGDEPAMFADHLDVLDPDRRWHVAIPRPPVATDEGPAWFTVGDDGPDTEQLTAAVLALAATLADLLDRFGLEPDDLVLGGFSQGGAMALAAALDPTVASRPGAVASLAAYLPHRHDDQDLTLLAGRPVLVAHGADDEVVDALLGRSAARSLHRGGALVTWSEVDGGHAIAGPLAATLAGWLAAVADGARPSDPPV
jgi:phospholipase/carboxylesterase